MERQWDKCILHVNCNLTHRYPLEIFFHVSNTMHDHKSLTLQISVEMLMFQNRIICPKEDLNYNAEFHQFFVEKCPQFLGWYFPPPLLASKQVVGGTVVKTLRFYSGVKVRSPLPPTDIHGCLSLHLAICLKSYQLPIGLVSANIKQINNIKIKLNILL